MHYQQANNPLVIVFMVGIGLIVVIGVIYSALQVRKRQQGLLHCIGSANGFISRL
jgi:ABC-type transport system involved in cytochrome c biogenesis permease component